MVEEVEEVEEVGEVGHLASGGEFPPPPPSSLGGHPQLPPGLLGLARTVHGIAHLLGEGGGGGGGGGE